MNGSLCVGIIAVLATAPGVDSLATLRAEFGEAIESTPEPALAVRYCPDNTCEVFIGGRRAAVADVADFALLYLWRLSDYTYLEQWHKQAPPAAVAAAVRRHADECSSRTEPERVACTLRALAKAAGISVSFVRYDEGAEVVENVDLEQQLRLLK